MDLMRGSEEGRSASSGPSQRSHIKPVKLVNRHNFPFSLPTSFFLPLRAVVPYRGSACVGSPPIYQRLSTPSSHRERHGYGNIGHSQGFEKKNAGHKIKSVAF